MTQQERNAKIDRCIAIQEEYKTLERPKMLTTSVEDCDDYYQEALEFDYYVADLKAEYDMLNKELGIIGKKLEK